MTSSGSGERATGSGVGGNKTIELHLCGKHSMSQLNIYYLTSAQAHKGLYEKRGAFMYKTQFPKDKYSPKETVKKKGPTELNYKALYLTEQDLEIIQKKNC